MAQHARINRLPEEILVYIFKHFVDLHECPVIGILLFVCRYWCDVVENTPLLWSRIAIYPKQGECNYEVLVKYIDKALEKSRNLPVDVWVNYSQMTTESDPPSSSIGSPSGLLNRLVGEDGNGMVRWRTFSLEVKRALNLEDGVWESFGPKAPILQDLYLHIPRMCPWSCALPSLRRLALDADGDMDEGHFGGLELDPTRLDTLYFRLWGDISVLEPFSNLRDLTIDNFIQDEYDGNQNEVHMDCLECFTIQWLYGYDLPVEMIQRLQVPSLNTLRLLGSMATMLILDATCFPHVRDLHILVEKVEAIRKEIMHTPFVESKLERYNLLEDLVVAPWHIDATIEALRNLRTKNEGPKSLRSLKSLVRDKKGKDIVDDASFAIVVVPWRSTADFTYDIHDVV